MGKGEMTSSLRLGRRRLPPLSVPGELFDLYQPLIGPAAHLALVELALVDSARRRHERSRRGFGPALRFGDVAGSIDTLIDFDLLERDDDGSLIVHEPLSADAFFVRFERPGLEQPLLPAIEEPRPVPVAPPVAHYEEQIGAAEPVAAEPPAPEIPVAAENRLGCGDADLPQEDRHDWPVAIRALAILGRGSTNGRRGRGLGHRRDGHLGQEPAHQLPRGDLEKLVQRGYPHAHRSDERQAGLAGVAPQRGATTA